ncbi:DUF3850 domain-containing protein [Rhodococcus sp. IEGM 1330]|uniref:DUF3850 domain-containing protein n=1 Tax=Rhodococcus sp. IEGM 1330 TaxID=3082225 RepID=UPI002952E725|nr:DUF3850 domain-containing protein [Rhodococcus sp. IEGM 1330]MDV8022311.1 DUF3850 domain-containing protein [Rhodococcus sp. IEGM 1330]
MTAHGIRITDHWARLLDQGVKTCELRLDDRDYQPGDTLTFYDLNGDRRRWMHVRTVTHVLKNFDGLTPGYVILSLDDPEKVRAKAQAEHRRERITRLERSNAALRGQITKLRKLLGST